MWLKVGWWRPPIGIGVCGWEGVTVNNKCNRVMIVDLSLFLAIVGQEHFVALSNVND